MSQRLPSAITSRPASRAYAHTVSKARHPSLPSASKNAACGLTATTYGATASTIPLQKRSTAPAAAALPPCASPRSSTGSRSTTGSRPTTSCDRLRSTASASRSAKRAVGAPAAASLVTRPRVSPPPPRESRPSRAPWRAARAAAGAGTTRRAAARRRPPGRSRPRRALRLCEQRLDLGERRRASRDEAHRRHPPAGDRVRADEARSPAGTTTQARSRRSRPSSRERLDRLLERSEPVAEARGVLEALLAREPSEPRPERRDRGLDVVRLVALEGARGLPGGALRRERPERGRLGRDAPASRRDAGGRRGGRAAYRARSPEAAAPGAAGAPRAPPRAPTRSRASRPARGAASAASTAGRWRSPAKYERSRVRSWRARPT